jgi:hypothetical protein
MIAAVSGGFECEFDQGSGEALLPGVGFGEIGLEAIAEGHQFIDFGDDAVLFGERGNGYAELSITVHCYQDTNSK